MSARILVVDNEPPIQELIAVNLARAGHVVLRSDDAEAALQQVHAALPDLILTDWILPGMSGIDLTRRFRSEPRTRNVSIIMLTARDRERDKVTALDAGADDYITKPFSPRELLARIAAVLRRREPRATEDAIEVGDLRLDPAARRVTVAEVELTLAETEFRLLHFFMAHADRVHSRTQLLDKVWGDHQILEERTVDVHIRRLRNGMAKGGRDQMIQTVRGTGYRFSASPE